MHHSRLAVRLLTFAETAWAQAGSAELFGRCDPPGLAGAGAIAELRDASTGLHSTAFGSIATAGDTRVLELALRVQF